MPEFPRLNKTSGVWKLNELPTYQLSGQWPSIGNRGVAAGGGDSQSTVIDYMEMAANGDFTDFGDLSRNTYGAVGGGNNHIGITMGGSTSPGITASPYINFIHFATTGNGGDFGDLLVYKRYTNGI